jgi:hypothetical protein
VLRRLGRRRRAGRAAADRVSFFYRVKLGWTEVLPEQYPAIPGPPPLVQ